MLISRRISIPSFYCHIFSCITCFMLWIFMQDLTKLHVLFIIDNIFIDNCRVKPFKVLPIMNCLSDHDAQYLTLNNVFPLYPCSPRSVPGQCDVVPGVWLAGLLLLGRAWKTAGFQGWFSRNLQSKQQEYLAICLLTRKYSEYRLYARVQWR
jgi:hypothetical protein